MKKILLFVLTGMLPVVLGITSLHAGYSPKGKPFVALGGQIVEVKGAISSLQDQIDLLVHHVDSIEQRVDANAAAIATLTVQNATMQNLIDNNLTTITDIQDLILSLELGNTDLMQQVSENVGDITALQAEIAENEALIASLESSILMIQDGVISLEFSLQEQIDNNHLLINMLGTEIDIINAELEFKQNLVNGICPDGSAVQQILPDGSVICGAAGGGTSGQIETVFSYTGLSANPGETVSISATCPEGYAVVSAGMTNAKGWDITKLHTSADSISTNAALLIATNGNSYRTWITAVATCLRMVP